LWAVCLRRIGADDPEKVKRYIGQTYPLRTAVNLSGSHAYILGEVVGDLATPLGLTGAFIKSERFLFAGKQRKESCGERI